MYSFRRRESSRIHPQGIFRPQSAPGSNGVDIQPGPEVQLDFRQLHSHYSIQSCSSGPREDHNGGPFFHSMLARGPEGWTGVLVVHVLCMHFV